MLQRHQAPSAFHDARRILLVKQSSLGDVIHTLPLVHALKRCRPEVSIGWIVQEGYRGLLEGDKAVDTVYSIRIPSTSEPAAGRGVYFRAFTSTYRTWRQLRQQCVQKPYDVVLDLHASFRSALLALANPGGVRLGFEDARELNPWFMHYHVSNPKGCEHALEKNLLFADVLNCPAIEEDFYIPVTEAAELEAQHLLAGETGKNFSGFIYLHTTARWASKYWQINKWIALAKLLGSAGYVPLFGGSKNDLSYIQKICDQLPADSWIVSAGKVSLLGTVALLKCCRAYIGLDSGPMHMAAMVGVPVVALFGPTHPRRVGPYGVSSVIVRASGLDCLCCRQRSCSHSTCMRVISAEQVFDALEVLLQKKRV
ncbi:MAG: ADP-heptose--LPS heptosyltransferase [Desulfobulbus propionicus]|nr:MAG: ADP-heptose--LPS heptosyltransferase [Desulfobulbus propionicus]